MVQKFNGGALSQNCIHRIETLCLPSLEVIGQLVKETNGCYYPAGQGAPIGQSHLVSRKNSSFQNGVYLPLVVKLRLWRWKRKCDLSDHCYVTFSSEMDAKKFAICL